MRYPHLPEAPRASTTPGRWVDAVDLRAGDELLLRGGRIAAVAAVRVETFSYEVYNFEVEELHCYAVGVSGVLVHNNCGIDAKAALDGLPGKLGKTGPVKRVSDEKTLNELFDSLSSGGKTVDPGNYPGIVKQLPDGTIVRMRPGSKSGGATLDVTLVDGRIYKVHIGL